MLQAFLSPDCVARLETMLSNSLSYSAEALRNLWTLSPTIHKAFRDGHVDARYMTQIAKVVDGVMADPIVPVDEPAGPNEVGQTTF